MKPLPVLLLGLVLFPATITPGRAQAAPQTKSPLDGVPFLAAAMSEVFSDSRAFSAAAIVQLPGDGPGEGVPLGFATLNGRMRWYLDLERARSTRLAPEMTSLLREAKLGQLILVVRPETNAIVAVPGLRQWFELPLPKAPELEDKAQEKVGFLEKTEAGREVVDGHPCVKYRLRDARMKEGGDEAFVWQATDLKNLPIKFQARVGGETYGLLFRQIKEEAPEARHFEPPAGYARAASPEAMLQTALLNSLTGGSDAGGAFAPGGNLLQLFGGEGR
jgi:hypothetical protein